MFIREVKKRVSVDGKKYDYVQHRLVESIRTANGPRQRTVLNLGVLDINRDKFKALANLIEAKITNTSQNSMFVPDPELSTLALHFAQIIVQKRLQDAPPTTTDTPTDKWLETVDLNTTIISNGRTVGTEHIALSQLRELGFFEILRECGFAEAQQKYAAAQVLGRLVHPSSERETARWLRDSSGLDELLKADFSKISDHTLHRAADQLLEYKEILEEQLSQTTSDLFKLDDKLILYDLTNTYFESSKRGSSLARYGKSKEKRTDCPLVTLALVVDGYGFPKQSQILQGNVSEPSTLWDILEQLVEQTDTHKPQTVIMDAGIATEDNLRRLRNDKRFEYVAVSRKKLSSELFETAPKRQLEISRNTMLQVQIIRTNEEAFLLCTSPEKKAKEEAMITSRKKKFETALGKLRNGLSQPRTRKTYDSVVERIGRIKEQYKVGYLYKIEVTQCDGKATDIQWQMLKNKIKEPGQYVIRTNRKELKNHEISMLHRTLTMVESSFRWLKSELGLRPNYHQLDQRVEAHIFISVLAYYVLAPILNKLNWGGRFCSSGPIKKEKKQWDVPYGWRGLVRTMKSQTRVTTSMRTEKNQTIDIRTTLEPSALQLDIYRRLNFTPRPLNRIIIKK